MRKVLFLFGQLNDDDVEWMLTAGAKRLVPAGGVLIEQGVPADALFILLEGKLAVWLRPRRGAERLLATLNAGEIVGEMSFVDARPPSTTVRERHRDLAPGGGAGEEEEEDDADELDPNVLDGVYLAGERFDRMVKRVLVS